MKMEKIIKKIKNIFVVKISVKMMKIHIEVMKNDVKTTHILSIIKQKL